MQYPVLESHNFTVLSHEAVAIFFPSVEYAQQLTIYLCPSKVYKQFPVLESHNFTVLSYEAVAIFIPSGEYAQQLTSL